LETDGVVFGDIRVFVDLALDRGGRNAHRQEVLGIVFGSSDYRSASRLLQFCDVWGYLFGVSLLPVDDGVETNPSEKKLLSFGHGGLACNTDRRRRHINLVQQKPIYALFCVVLFIVCTKKVSTKFGQQNTCSPNSFVHKKTNETEKHVQLFTPMCEVPCNKHTPKKTLHRSADV